MIKYLVIRSYENKDYLYTIKRASSLEQASELVENDLINKNLQDEGIFTITPLADFHYENNKIILPEGASTQVIVIAPINANPLSYLNEHLKN